MCKENLHKYSNSRYIRDLADCFMTLKKDKLELDINKVDSKNFGFTTKILFVTYQNSDKFGGSSEEILNTLECLLKERFCDLSRYIIAEESTPSRSEGKHIHALLFFEECKERFRVDFEFLLSNGVKTNPYVRKLVQNRSDKLIYYLLKEKRDGINIRHFNMPIIKGNYVSRYDGYRLVLLKQASGSGLNPSDLINKNFHMIL